MDQTDVITLVRRGWWVLAALAVLGAATAFLTRERPEDATPRWQAKATISDSADAITSEQQIRLRRLGAEALRPPVIDEVATDVGLSTGAIRSSVVPTLNIKFGGVDLITERTTGDEARTLADALATAVVARERADAGTAKTERIATLYGQITAIDTQLGDVRNALDDGRDPSLLAERDRLQVSLTEAFGRLDEVQRAPSPADRLQVLPAFDAVDLTAGTSSTSPIGRTVGGALVGLVLGLVALVLVDRFDPKLRDRRAVERAVGTTVLTAIAPSRDGWPADGAPASDGYRTLRVALRDHEPGAPTHRDGRHPRTGSLRADGIIQTVLVTSPSSRDGRSTVAANLATALAEVGWAVVLVDAHHASPIQHSMAGLHPGPGMSDACADPQLDDPEQADLAPCLQATAVPGLLLMASGRPVTNPATLMAREPSVLRALRAWADYIVVDCPPVVGSNDALELSGAADAIVVVTRAGHTKRAPAARAAELLRLVGAPVFGAVLLGGTAVVEPTRRSPAPPAPLASPDPARAG